MGDKITGYRGDIQIYRAIAVLQVLLFHMEIPGYFAGFLGVDIFFVISGYLMAVLYKRETTPLEFYEKRARRLMPAYFVTIVCTFFAAFFVTIPTDFQQVSEQVQFASVLSSNIGFWLHNSYFSKNEFNPLLHLWSLGVECQFYLIFPALVWVSRRFKYALVAIVALSMIACFSFVLVSPKLSFFMVPMRIWEFGIGMWVAAQPKSHKQGTIWGVVGLIGMLLIPLLPIQGEQRELLGGHPALAALLISCSTALALHYRLPSGLIESRIGRAGQRLGDVSYSLYLAHWPVLILLHYVPFGGTQSGVSGVIDAAISIGAVMAATAILYRFFERPGPKLFTPRRGVVVATLALAISSILPQFQVERFDLADKRIFAAWSDRAPYRCGKIFRIWHPTEQLCEIGDGGRGAVLLIGDSHADAIKQTFATAASAAGFRTYFAVDNTPLITPALDKDWLVREVHRRGAKAVFLHFSSRNLAHGLIDGVGNALAEAQVPVYLIMPTPEYEEHVPQRLYAQKHAGVAFPTQGLAEYRRRNAAVIAEAHRAHVAVLETAALFCAPVCRVSSADGDLFYFDGDHLTLHGAAVIAPALAPALADLVRK